MIQSSNVFAYIDEINIKHNYELIISKLLICNLNTVNNVRIVTKVIKNVKLNTELGNQNVRNQKLEQYNNVIKIFK